MKNFFSAMLKCKDKIYERRDRAAADVFKKVQDFVESGNYSSCKKADDIAKMTLKGYNPNDIAEYFGLSFETIKVEKRKISMELWQLFPKDFFDRLVTYRENKEYIDDCLYSVSTYSVDSNNLLLLDVAREIQNAGMPASDESFDISDLRDELDFLIRYSKPFLKKNISSLNPDKLRYLSDVINGKSGDPLLRAKVLKELYVDSK